MSDRILMNDKYQVIMQGAWPQTSNRLPLGVVVVHPHLAPAIKYEHLHPLDQDAYKKVDRSKCEVV